MPRGVYPNHISGERHHRWNSGRMIASNGYVKVRAPESHLADRNGYAYEHRIVAEEILGRPLTTVDLVHHRNEIKTRPENLEITTKGAHNHHHNIERGRDSVGHFLGGVRLGAGDRLDGVEHHAFPTEEVVNAG